MLWGAADGLCCVEDAACFLVPPLAVLLGAALAACAAALPAAGAAGAARDARAGRTPRRRHDPHLSERRVEREYEALTEEGALTALFTLSR